MVFFESPRRLAATLADLASAFGPDRPRRGVPRADQDLRGDPARDAGRARGVGGGRPRRDHARRGRRSADAAGRRPTWRRPSPSARRRASRARTAIAEVARIRGVPKRAVFDAVVAAKALRQTAGVGVTTLGFVNDRILTAVAWPYANGPRHIGHVAGFGVPSDVFSRYQRMAGNRVLMISGTDEHGTPIQVQADAEGMTPRELADRNALVIAKDLQDLGLSYDLFTRTTTQNHYAIDAGAVPRTAEERLRLPEDAARRDQPVDRTHAAGPLHRGHLPDLRLPARARRPVRQLRQPARPDRPDRPGVEDQRRDADVRRDRALLPRPAGVRRGARRLAAQADALAAECPEVQPESARRPQAAGDHP